MLTHKRVIMIYNCYSYPNDRLKSGDLVFFKPKTIFESGFASAILDSSPTGKAFYHVAMVIRVENNLLFLLDATPLRGTEILEYNNLCKTHGFFHDIEVMRVNLPAHKITTAVNNAVNLVGSEYNDLFSPEFINSKGKISFYCSQIIQYVFNMAAWGEIFSDIPMNFKDHTGEISQYWQYYYEGRSAIVPQDAPGTHPASIYESESLMCF